MDFPRLLPLTALLLLLSACDTQTESVHSAARVLPAGDIDLRFTPADLKLGESLSFQGRAGELRSTKVQENRHEVTIGVASSRVVRVQGLLDGALQFSDMLDGNSAGHTTQTPTSVHRHTVCQGNTCTDIVEYDYDLHDADGEGTTAWTSPSAGRALIDRLRFEVASSDVFGGAVLASPAALVFEDDGSEPLR